MIDVKFGDLVERMAISLAVVLGLMFVAYKILKRRQNGSSVRAPRSSGARLGGGVLSIARSATASRSSRSARTTRSPGSRAANAKRGLKVIARVGVSKTSSVLAVQFGERVYMLGATEQSPPAVLAEIDLSAWNASLEDDENSDQVVRVPVVANPLASGNRQSIVEVLRERTARRA